MAQDRDDIPAALQRSLMMEVGFRCAIPNCRTVDPLEIEHINEWSQVKEHKFENMIVLCANCHRRKGTGPRRLDTKALKQLKANLGLVNNRYNDTERRILEHFVENGENAVAALPATEILFSYLLKDELLQHEVSGQTGFSVISDDPDTTDSYIIRGYELTSIGKAFVRKMRDNEDLYSDTYRDTY